jgi:hypothetical protein
MKQTRFMPSGLRLALVATLVSGGFGASVMLPARVAAASPPVEWDGLQRRKVSGLDNVYIRPDVAFTAYKRVRILPAEVAFDRNWKPNRDMRDLSRRLSDEDIERIRDGLAKGLSDTFAKRLQKAGYTVVDTNADDVLAVRAGLINVYINAPDTMSAGRSRSYVQDAGRMTLVMELHDSGTAQLLARVVDTREGMDNGRMQWANSVTNTAEAERMFGSWADRLVRALDKVNGKTKK